jgi:hypothetical protein
MKGKISVFLMVGLVVSLFALTILAQAEEQKAQLFEVDEYAVMPSMVEEFETCIKEFVALCTQHKYPYTWMAYSINDFHYILVWQLKNYADLDNWSKASSELAEKVGKEQWQALFKRFLSSYEYLQEGMYYLIPERSYTPENPRLKPEEINFIRWGFYYLRPAKGEAFAENDKDWVALHKKKNIPDGWNIYEGDIGTDRPVVVLSTWGKDAVDYFSQYAKNEKILGEEAEALSKKENAFLRKYESRTGRPRPDLSYMPKEK